MNEPVDYTELYNIIKNLSVFSGLEWIDLDVSSRWKPGKMFSSPIDKAAASQYLALISKLDPDNTSSYSIEQNADNSGQYHLVIDISQVDEFHLNNLKDKDITSKRAKTQLAFFKPQAQPKSQEELLQQLLPLLQDNTITVYSMNHSDGVGDAKHAIDFYCLLKDIFKNSNTTIKLVLLVDQEKLEVIRRIIPVDLRDKVGIGTLGNMVPDTEANKDIIILSGYVGKTNMVNEYNDLAKKSILATPALQAHVKKSNSLFNISTPFNRNISATLKDDCGVYAILEYGRGTFNQSNLSFSIPQRVLTASMGAHQTEVGFKFNKAVWNAYENMTSDSDKAAELLKLNKSLLDLILNKPTNLDLKTEEKLELAKEYLTNHQVAIGYVQNSFAAMQLIQLCYETRSPNQSVDIIMPSKHIDKALLDKFLEKNGSPKLTIVKADGSVISEHGTNKPEIRIIDYQGLENNEMDILTSVSNVIAGSGDSSFSAALSNPSALPFFTLPDWKDEFYKDFFRSLDKHDTTGKQYEHLKIYLGLMNGATRGGIDPNSKMNIVDYAKQHKDKIINEWRGFVNYLHENKNVETYLSNIALSVVVRQIEEEKNLNKISP